jgi:hypothetical protein
VRSFCSGALGVELKRGGQLFNIVAARFSIATPEALKSRGASIRPPSAAHLSSRRLTSPGGSPLSMDTQN